MTVDTSRYSSAIIGVIFVAAIASTSPVPNGYGSVHDAEVVPQISVAVSSLASIVNGHIEERQLELSWWTVNGANGYLPGDRVVLFQYLSEDRFCQPTGSAVIQDVPVAGASSSWIRLNVTMPYFAEGDLIDDRCQLYWAAYVRQDGQIVSCNCLRARPSWMWDARAQLQAVKLRELLLPGTHDAAAYAVYNGAISDNIATKYAITQNENLYSQLAMGVRYMDMRIAFRPSNGESRFWTNHGAYYLRPLVQDTALVREFLSRSREIVIFDIHSLDGMDQEPGSHRELQDLLYAELGPWMAPNSLTWDATLGDFWSTNDKRLVVTYDDAAVQQSSNHLWPIVQHQWGNVNSVVDLENYLQSVMDRAAQGEFTYPWSSMAEMTPSTSDVVVDRFGGLRVMADLVNRNVTTWYRDRWAPLATIVANDFFLGSNIVEVAIQENLRRYP